MPFLEPIIMFSDIVSTNLVIQYTLDSLGSIFYRKTDYDPTNTIIIIMNNTSRSNRIFYKLVG